MSDDDPDRLGKGVIDEATLEEGIPTDVDAVHDDRPEAAKMDETCDKCGASLSPVLGRISAGRRERMGVCPSCFDSKSKTVVVSEHDRRKMDDGNTLADLVDRRTNAPVDADTVAAYIGRGVPPVDGEIVVRQDSPERWRVFFPDGALTAAKNFRTHIRSNDRFHAERSGELVIVERVDE